jgi:DNA-binding XRE family transcriptional regulator
MPSILPRPGLTARQFAQRHQNRSDKIGVFCRYVLADRDFPRGDHLPWPPIKRYLAGRIAPPRVLAAAADFWSAWHGQPAVDVPLSPNDVPLSPNDVPLSPNDVPLSPNAAMIRVWRTHRGMTLPELAALAGITAASLAEIESGEKNASANTLAALARALTIDRYGLLAG